MKKLLIGLLGFLLIIGLLVGYVVSAKFTAEKYEQAVIAQDEKMQNVWGMMEQQLKLQGFTVQNYGKTFIDSIKANAVRYENDKSSMMKWVQEASSQMSPETHTKFMDAIEKAYAKKERIQSNKISVVQEYRTYLKTSIKGTVSGFIGYPQDTTKTIMDRIISTGATKTTWETGQEAEVTNPFK